MSKVFICNVAGHDFSQALKYGELIPVTEGNMNLARPDRDLYNISAKLKEFDYTKDYLLLSGNVFVNALVVAVLLYYQVKAINFLIYDAKNMTYIHHHLSLQKELKFIQSQNQATV